MESEETHNSLCTRAFDDFNRKIRAPEAIRQDKMRRLRMMMLSNRCDSHFAKEIFI
jgi:hypothetical protein